jgi:hypothetical protein
VLLIGFISLSALSFPLDWDWAMSYHDRSYVVGTAIISVVWWSVLGALAFAARRYPGPGLNLLFHMALFSWLAWYALPYYGELP